MSFARLSRVLALAVPLALGAACTRVPELPPPPAPRTAEAPLPPDVVEKPLPPPLPHLRAVEAPLPPRNPATVTVTPVDGETILIGTPEYLRDTGLKGLRLKWLEEGHLKELTTPTVVEVVARGTAHSTVRLDGKEWLIESKWLSAVMR